jgi:hypothetical protein
MKNETVFNDFLEKLQLNSNILDAYEKEIPEEIRLQHDQIKLMEETIRKEISPNPLINESVAIVWLLKIIWLLDQRGITIDNYKERKEEGEQAFLSMIFEPLIKFNTRKEFFEKKYYLMQDAVLKTDKLGPNIKFEDINVSKISSSFIDYYILKDWKEWLKKSGNPIASGVLNMLPDLKKALRNAVNLMEAPVDELADISLYSNQPKMRGLKLFLTEEMIKSLKIPLDIIDELNEKLFNRGITKDLIELILKQIEKLEKAIDFQYMFTHLYNIFGEHVDMSLRAKKLLMHEIFLIYEHPMAITDKDEEKHFRDYPESTNETIDMRKIRVIELLIPDLK